MYLKPTEALRSKWELKKKQKKHYSRILIVYDWGAGEKKKFCLDSIFSPHTKYS